MWFTLYVIFLVLAFIGTVYFTWKLFDSGNRVQQAIQEDARARVEAAGQDASVKIEAGKAEALKETKRIESEANVKIAEANVSAGKANERASVLEKDAASLKLKAEELKSQNLATEAKLEAERAELVKLETALAPRTLPFKQYTDSSTNVDDLRKFAGTEIVLEYFPDWEAHRTAANLAFLFKQAGWGIVFSGAGNPNIRDGVIIEGYRPSQVHLRELEGNKALEIIKGIEASGEVVDTIEAWLLLNTWQASHTLTVNDLKPNQVRVSVGLKPNPYITSRKELDARQVDQLTKLAPNANPAKTAHLTLLPDLTKVLVLPK
jgi:hypothetical protein